MSYRWACTSCGQHVGVCGTKARKLLGKEMAVEEMMLEVSVVSRTSRKLASDN